MKQIISELDSNMSNFIHKQVEWVNGHVDPEKLSNYASAEAKARLLQNILKQDWYNKTQTAELQALGIFLGEILTEFFDLKWVKVEDEYGIDPALKYKDTSIILFPRTMISKRIERDETVDVNCLLKQTENAISEALKP